MIKRSLFYFFACLSLVFANEGFAAHQPKIALLEGKAYRKSKDESYANFDDNSHFTKKMRRAMRPYLIPKDHPAKLFLDDLFATANVIKNEKIFSAAGFETVSTKTMSRIRVARHPALPGYVFKLYLCTMQRTRAHEPVWMALTARCQGAQNIRKLIKEKNLQHFIAPHKWLYIVPKKTFSDLSSKEKKQFVLLVATDMQPMGMRSSAEAWRNHVTHNILDELFCILSNGYASTFLSGNIPYTHQGKFACLDTEFPLRVNNFFKVEKYIAPELLSYWRELQRH